jgi:WD40 repeat protein
VPGFEIEAEVGRGGWGVVYRARQTQLNRTVALKMILAGAHAGAEERARFLAEAEAIAALHHPGIVQVHELGTCDGLPYFALEYCPGGSLAGRLAGTPLPSREAAALLEQVARAVQAAHEKGIVHRDLKPANILLDASGSPLVTDFGLARRLEASGGLTQTGAVMGTPSYMAPEQARGQRVGPAADVYALGAILYECLTGRPPFKAATTHETLYQVIEDEPASLRQMNARVPRDLETVCLKCLHKDPARRYASALDLANDLRRWLAGEPIQARPVRLAERGWKWVKRRPAVAGLLLMLAVLTVGSLAAIATLYREAVAQAKAAGKERDTAEDARKVAEEAQGAAEERAQMSQHAFRLAHCQREAEAGNIEQALKLFDACEPQRSGWERGHLWLQIAQGAARRREAEKEKRALKDNMEREKENKEEREKASQELLKAFEKSVLWLDLPEKSEGRDRAQSICFSRAGHLVVAGFEQGGIHLWDANTGRHLRTLGGRRKLVWSVDLSSDGQWLVSATGTKREDGALTLWNVKTGQLHRRLQGPPAVPLGVRFAPDGSWLASHGDADKIQVWEIPSGRLLRTFEAPGPVSSLAVHPEGTMLAYGSKEQVYLRDVQTGEVRHTLTSFKSTPESLAFSGDGKLLASATLQGGDVSVWDVATGKHLKSLVGGGQATCVAFAPGKRPLLAFGHTGTQAYTIIDLSAQRTICAVPTDNLTYEGASFSPDGDRIAFNSGNRVGIVSLNRATLARNGARESKRPTVRGPKRPDPEPEWVRRFEALGRMMPPRIVLKAHEVKVQLRQRAVGHSGGLCVLDGDSGLPLASFPAGPGGAEKPVLLSPDGSLRAEVQELAILLRDVKSGSTHYVPRPEGPVTLLAFTRDGTRLAAAGEKAIKLWDARTGVELMSWGVGQYRSPASAHSEVGSSSLGEAARGFDEVLVSVDGREVGPRPANPEPTWIVQHLGFDEETGALVLVSRGEVEILASLAQGSAISSARWELLRVITAEQQGRWEDAAAILGQLLRAHPGSASLHWRRARALVRCSRISEAVVELKRGSECPSKTSSPLDWWLTARVPDALAAHALEEDEFRITRPGLDKGPGDRRSKVPDPLSPEKARLLAAVSHALSAEPKSWSLRALRGWLLVRAGKIDSGADDLAAAARLNPSRADLWGLVAWAELKRGRPGAADAAHQEFARLAPGDVPRWHREQAADPDNAGHPLLVVWHLGHLLPTLARSPETGKLFVRRGECLAKLSRWKEAAADFAEGAALLPGNVGVRCRQARCALAAGDLAGYRGACRDLVRRWPANEKLGYQVARTCVLAPDALPDMAVIIRLAQWSIRGPVDDPSRLVPTDDDSPLIAAALVRARRFSDAVTYLSNPELLDDLTCRRLLLLAHRQQGQHREADRLEARWLGSLAVHAAGLAGLGAGPLPGLGMVSRVLLLESRKKLRLEWSDWRDLLPEPLSDEGKRKVSKR